MDVMEMFGKKRSSADAVELVSKHGQNSRSKETRLFIMLGLTLGLLLASLDSTVVGTSLPHIVGELGGINLYTWVITSYLLSSTILIPIAGKLSDIYGRKPVFLSGILIFLAGSALSGMSQSIEELIAFRFIQGIGAGILLPVVLAAVADFYAPAERARIQSILGGISAITMVIGPFIGGFIVDNMSWRWVFYVNLPIGILALLITSSKFPKQMRDRSKSIDYLGLIAMSISLLALMLMITWGGDTFAWWSAEIVGLGILSLMGLASFIFIERRAEDPLIPLRLFRNSVFTLSSIGLFLIGMGMFAVLSFLPLFLQAVIGVSATNSGETLIPLVIGMIAMVGISGAVIKRTGYKIWLLMGPPITAVGLFLLSTLKTDSSQAEALLYTLIIGLGIGAVIANYLVAAQNVLSKKDMGVGTSTTKLIQNLGGTVGVTLLGSVLNSRMAIELNNNLPTGASAYLPSTKASTLGQLLLNPAATADIPATIIDTIRLSLDNSMAYIFLLAAVITAITFVVNLMIKNVPLKSDEEYHETDLEGTTSSPNGR